MKHIPVSTDIWRKLRKIRDKLGFKHYSKTLQWLLQQACFQDKNTIALDSEIFGRLAEIKEDNGYDTIDETIDCLIEELLECQEMNEQKQEGN